MVTGIGAMKQNHIFVKWYNRRIHGALWLEIGENPEGVFIRKAPPESLLGLFFSLTEKLS